MPNSRGTGSGEPSPRRRRPPTVVDIDLNLLVVLDAVLTERSVSRAAQRLHRTQSATSHALARLRTLFDDPLLVKVGTAMVPTERASQLQAELSGALAGLDDILSSGARFDSASTRQRFRIAVPDFLPGLGPSLVTAILKDAPHSSVDIVAAHPGVIDETVASALDLAITFGGVTRRSLMSLPLGSVPWRVFVRRGHPLVAADDRRKALRTADRVTVRAALGSPRDPEALPSGVALGSIKVAVPSYAEVAAVLTATNLVAVVPEPALAGYGGELTGVELGRFETGVELSAYWSRLLGGRPHHPWLRRQVRVVTEGWRHGIAHAQDS